MKAEKEIKLTELRAPGMRRIIEAMQRVEAERRPIDERPPKLPPGALVFPSDNSYASV